jgi:hypothetical protein
MNLYLNQRKQALVRITSMVQFHEVLLPRRARPRYRKMMESMVELSILLNISTVVWDASEMFRKL